MADSRRELRAAALRARREGGGSGGGEDVVSSSEVLIKTISRAHCKLRSILRSPNDKSNLDVPGVYKIPCDSGKCYVGETRRNVNIKITEHIRSVKNADSNGSAITEHVLGSGTAHYIRFNKASVLAREKFLVPRKIREAIEIGRLPNFNRDSGWTLPSAWKPVINTIKHSNNLVEFKSDTVSSVCTQRNITTSDEDPQESSEDDATSSPPPLPPPSRRALKAAARSSRRESAMLQAHE